MKNFTQLLQPHFQIFRQRRFIFDNEAAPPSPETFKGTEKTSDAQIANEVGPMSPSQIASNAAARTTAIQSKYIKKAGSLAGLMPVGGSQSSTTTQIQPQNGSTTGKGNPINTTENTDPIQT